MDGNESIFKILARRFKYAHISYKNHLPPHPARLQFNPIKGFEVAGEKIPAVSGASNLVEKVIDAEAKLKLAKDKTLKLEKELMLAKETESKVYLLEEKQSKVVKEKEDVLTEWERLKAFESKAKRLIRELIESEFFGGQFANQGKYVNQERFEDDPNILDKLEEVMVFLKEREAISQEQFQDGEHMRTELEDKFNMESEFLHQKKIHRYLKENELNNAVARLNALEMNLACFEEKVLALEAQLMFSINKIKEYEEIVNQTEHNFVETFKRALESDYLRVIYESRENEMEQILILLEEEFLGLHQKIEKYKQAQAAMNKMEANHFKVVEEFKCSKHDSFARIKKLESALLTSQKKEHELQEKLIAAQGEVCSYQNIAKHSTERLFEVQNLDEVLQGLLNEMQKKLRTCELHLKRASQRELVLQTKLKDYEVKFPAQESTLQSMAASIKELEQLLESQVNGPEMKFMVEKENYAFSEAKELSKKLITLVGHVKESDDQVADASLSAVAKDLELQVLYAKLTEIEVLVQQIQGEMLTTDDRARHAEAECTYLSEKNSTVNDEFAHLQLQMVELQTTLNQVEREKELASSQLTSTVKSINDLIEQLVNERQHLQKNISIVAKDHNNLNEKHLSLKNEYRVLLSKHESELKKANEREKILKEKLLDLKARLGKHTGLDGHLAGLEQMPQLVEKELRLGTKLVNMYSTFGSVDDARQVFDKITRQNVVLWTTLINGYARNALYEEALRIYFEMKRQGIQPDDFTFSSVLKACAGFSSLEHGRGVHAHIIKRGSHSNVFVCSALVDMYAKCGSIEDSCLVFDKMSERNVVSWNTIISGFSLNGDAKKAMEIFCRMIEDSIKPNSGTLVSILRACTHLVALNWGKEIHAQMLKTDLECNAFVGSALVAMYAQCKRLEAAHRVFDRISDRDVVLWSAMIAAYSQNGLANDALKLFRQMHQHDIKPNSVTISGVLPACGDLASLKQGKEIHCYVIRNKLDSNEFVFSALIDMYAKCGHIIFARQVFDRKPLRDVISWTAMISAYGMNGYAEEAIKCFHRMQKTGLKPNDVTFVVLLSACSHVGLVTKGWQYFESMSQDYHIKPRVEHYACMTDLLGRAGRLRDAQVFIQNMPVEPSAGVWGALLSACRIHFNVELGENVARHLFAIEPKNAGNYILLSNIYAAAGRWNDVERVRKMMNDRGIQPRAGCSWIEVKNEIHLFLVGDE